MITLKSYSEENYKVIFNRKSGFFARLEDNGFKEPFYSKTGPELLDVSITNFCNNNCNICYRHSSPSGKHITLGHFELIVNQAIHSNVFQIALGGGNPVEHPDFLEILEICITNGIVPNYTTSGYGLTNDILKKMESCCGAMAISLYNPIEDVEQIIKKISNYNIKLNIHFVVSNENVFKIIELLKNPPEYFKMINAVILLNYKPHTKIIANYQQFLLNKSTLIDDLFNVIKENPFSFKIGFDSCFISGISNYLSVNNIYIDYCEAGRFSAFINEELIMYPCSFLENVVKGYDIRERNILDIWQNGDSFKNIRGLIENNGCNSCSHQSQCMGGCPYFKEINICS